MAYNKILVIHSAGHLKRAVAYSMSEEKTRDKDNPLEALTGYAANGAKTERGGVRYVSGINCFPETAAEKMAATKERFGKEDKRVAYHIIQSFAPGEITPELAHDIGVKYAEVWLGEYEVVIGTHLDRGHLHNHIVCNSVSCMDGHKFHMDNSEFYTKLYGISNDLCRRYGLSVIENIDCRHMPYAEWLRRYGRGGRTLREIIRADILECITEAQTVGGFYMLMENRGYEVDTSGKYAKVRPPERERFFRLETLGFPDGALRDRIAGKQLTRRRARPVYYGCGLHRDRGHKLTRIEAMYVRWLFVLGKIRAGKPYARVPAEELKKFEKYKEQLKFLAVNRLSGLREAVEMQTEVAGQIKRLDEEKFRLRGAIRKNSGLFKAHQTYMRYLPIADRLDGEHRERFGEAKEVLRKKGFEGKTEEVGERRAALLDATARNRQELVQLHGRLEMLDGILAGAGHMEKQIQETEEKEKWKEKRQDSLSRERR